MEAIIWIILALAIAGIVWIIGKMIIDLLPLPPQIKQINNLLMILLLVLIIVYYAIVPLLHMATARHF